MTTNELKELMRLSQKFEQETNLKVLTTNITNDRVEELCHQSFDRWMPLEIDCDLKLQD